MTDDELQKKVTNLRSKLNDGRNHITFGTSSTGGDTVSYNSSVDSPQRGTSKNVRTTNSGTTRRKAVDSPGARSSDGAERGFEAIANRERPSTNGHEQDNSDASAARYDDKGTIARGRLIRDENEPPKRASSTTPTSIFTAIPHRGPGRPKKQEEAKEDRVTVTSIKPEKQRARDKATSRQFKNPLTSFIPKSQVLSQQEADDFIKPLGSAFVDYGTYFDEYIRIKRHDPSLVFFGDLSYAEGEVLAKVILRLGKQNSQVASATRTIVSGNDYISAIIILWPRISKLVDALGPEPKATTSNRPIRPNPAFSLFRKVELRPPPQGENNDG